jgi:iron(III) transport system substrate-binding protein
MLSRTFLAIPFLLASLFIASCGGPKRTPLVIYSPHGSDLLKDIEARFEAAHPDVDVEWLDMGSQECLDRVRAERGNPQCDVWWGAPSTMFRTAEGEGLLETFRPSWAEAIASEEHGAAWWGTFQTPEVIMFNSRMLTKESAPRDWDDLLRPEWRDKIIIRSPIASGTMRTIFCAIIAREAARTGSVDSGFAWLKRLDANTHAYAPDQTSLYMGIAREEAPVTVWNMPDAILQREQHHQPFDAIVPASGTPVLTDGIAVVHGAAHADLAHQFIEFVGSMDVLTDLASKYGRIPSRTDIDTSKLPEWMRTPIRKMPVDWSLLTLREREWMSRWNTEVRTGR